MGKPGFDPKCKEARILASYHDREGAIAKDLQGSRLWQVLQERRVKDYATHVSICERCWTHARSCASCGVDMTKVAHRFSCPDNPAKWRGLFRKQPAPLAHEASQRPGRPRPAPAPGPRPAPTFAFNGGPTPASPRAAAPRPPTAHEVLGLKPGATGDEIRRAFREKAMEYHPDRVQGLGSDLKQLAEVKMREINAAYEELLRLKASAK